MTESSNIHSFVLCRRIYIIHYPLFYVLLLAIIALELHYLKNHSPAYPSNRSRRFARRSYVTRELQRDFHSWFDLMPSRSARYGRWAERCQSWSHRFNGTPTIPTQKRRLSPPPTDWWVWNTATLVRSIIPARTLKLFADKMASATTQDIGIFFWLRRGFAPRPGYRNGWRWNHFAKAITPSLRTSSLNKSRSAHLKARSSGRPPTLMMVLNHAPPCLWYDGRFDHVR